MGDVVWIGPGERHWHGAADNSMLMHMAISIGAADWAEAVSAADFAQAGADFRRSTLPAPFLVRRRPGRASANPSPGITTIAPFASLATPSAPP